MVLESSLADCVLADSISILPHLAIPPTTIVKVRGLQKVWKLVTEKPKKGDVRLAKIFSRNKG